MANWDQSLSTAHISNDYANYEAARSAFFTLIIDDIDGLIKATVKNRDTATDADKFNKAQEYLKLNVVSTKVPHFSVEKMTYTRGNEKVHFAGVPTFDDGEIVVDDIVGLDTKAILMAWQALTYDVHTRKGGRMKDYKKNATLIEYTQDFEQIRSWTLYGCWISNITEDPFNKEQDGKRAIRATIVYDRAAMNLDNKVEG